MTPYFQPVAFLSFNPAFFMGLTYSTYGVKAEEVREIWKFHASLSRELPIETLTLQQIGLGIAEINRKLESLKS